MKTTVEDWDSKDGQTHFQNDGCGEKKHNCGCACHNDVRKINSLLHDTQCCAEMNGTLAHRCTEACNPERAYHELSKPSEPRIWEKQFSEELGTVGIELAKAGFNATKFLVQLKAFISEVERKAEKTGHAKGYEYVGTAKFHHEAETIAADARAEERKRLYESVKDIEWQAREGCEPCQTNARNLKVVFDSLTNPEK